MTCKSTAVLLKCKHLSNCWRSPIPRTATDLALCMFLCRQGTQCTFTRASKTSRGNTGCIPGGETCTRWPGPGDTPVLPSFPPPHCYHRVPTQRSQEESPREAKVKTAPSGQIEMFVSTLPLSRECQTISALQFVQIVNVKAIWDLVTCGKQEVCEHAQRIRISFSPEQANHFLSLEFTFNTLQDFLCTCVCFCQNIIHIHCSLWKNFCLSWRK